MRRKKQRGHSSDSYKSLSTNTSLSLQSPSVNPLTQEALQVASLAKVSPNAPQALAVAEPMPCVSPFALYDGLLSEYEPVPQRWLWPGRIPLGTITLLDGDLSCGKSLLSQQIAAHVSAGSPLPDGSATIRGGVVIVIPHEDARKAMHARLKANGADLERIRLLSFVHDQEAENVTLPGTYRPFQLPDDLEVLRAAMQQVDARLVIIDPFLSVLPMEGRFSQSQLHRLLMQLHQLMIEMDATCLITRQCPAKGGTARPSSLERSMHFANLAASRLLLARDPLEPERFLLTQVACRVQALAPTITFSIASPAQTPHLSHITCQGPHSLQASDLLTQRPATLSSLLLGQRICTLVAQASEPVSLDTIREHIPRSASSQLQRTVRRLVQEKMLTCPVRGLYTLAQTEMACSA